MPRPKKRTKVAINIRLSSHDIKDGKEISDKARKLLDDLQPIIDKWSEKHGLIFDESKTQVETRA